MTTTPKSDDDQVAEMDELATAGIGFLGRSVSAEWGWGGSSSSASSEAGGFPWGNPDEVVRRKGFGYLREMERKNGFLYGVLRTRQQSLLRKRWQIQPASKDERDVMIASFVSEALERIEGSFLDDLRHIGNAIRYGYSIAELVWQPWESASYGRRMTLRAIKDKPPEEFQFQADRYGNLTSLMQLTPVHATPSRERRVLPLHKFVHYVFESEGENPYGHGLLSRCYWHDWFMREGWKFWAVYLERFGSPLVRATVPHGTTPAQREELESVISSIQDRTGIVIPEGFALDFVEATRSGVAGYREFVAEQKEAIAVVVLGETLTTYVGTHGSQALGSVHQATKDEIVAADAEALATVVNEQIIRRLVDLNFAGVDKYPMWVWEVTDTRELETLARIVARLNQSGIRVPTEWVYRTFGVPMPKPDETVLSTSTD